VSQSCGAFAFFAAAAFRFFFRFFLEDEDRLRVAPEERFRVAAKACSF
jgi:hypothetical protein